MAQICAKRRKESLILTLRFPRTGRRATMTTLFFEEATVGRGVLVRTVAMKPDRLLVVFVALYLVVIAILLIKDAPRPAPPENKTPVAKVETAPTAPETKPDAAPAPAADAGKPGASPDCEKELRRTADLLRFFANRIQGGEDTQTVVADMRQQEKKIAAVCD